MSRVLEFAAATGAALALHFVALGLVVERVGVSGAGAAGQALVSLDAAPAALSALVADWETPPETALPASAALPVPEGPAPQPVVPRRAEVPVVPPRIAALSPPAADSAVVPPEPAAPPPESTAPQLAEAPAPTATRAPAPLAPPAVTPAPLRPQPPVADTAPLAAEPAAETAIAPQTSPLPKPRPSTARTAQRAAGGSGAGAAGTAGQAEAASADPARNASDMAVWGAGIRARIEARQRFPAVAPGLHGNVTIDLAVARGGALAAVTIAASSGNPAFDAAALAAARAASPFAPAPAALSSPQYSFRLVIRFQR